MCAFVCCALIHLPWFHNRALTLTDNSGQTDMFLGQQKRPIAPPQLIHQLLSNECLLTFGGESFSPRVDASASCLVDLCY